MTRLHELLSKGLTRGRDDAKLDELAQLLDKYRRNASAWERVYIDGRDAYTRQFDCGHSETVFSPARPRGGIAIDPDGAEIEIPLAAVCRTCCRIQADA